MAWNASVVLSSSCMLGMMYSKVCHILCLSSMCTDESSAAMIDAYRLDSRIHRDISLGNIVLTKEPGRNTRRGVLIDWEVSSKVDENGESCDRQRMVSLTSIQLNYPFRRCYSFHMVHGSLCPVIYACTRGRCRLCKKIWSLSSGS